MQTCYSCNAKIGKCHRYSEYDKRPVPTNIFDLRILFTKLCELEYQIIKQVPTTVIKVKNDGVGIFSKK